MSKKESVQASQPDNATTAEENGMPERRSWFYDAAAFVIGGIVGMVPLGVGLFTFIDPLRRSPSIPKAHGKGTDPGGIEGSVRVASLAALPIGGAPQRFPVIANHFDAWNFTPNQPVGAVFLQRVSDKEIRCFNATCPHAGCSVGCDGKAFVCPCHNSSFELDGVRRSSESGRENPSPRDMDSLEVDPEKLGKGEIWVKFQNFYTGRHEKVPKA